MEYSKVISFSIPKLDADVSSETSVSIYHTKGRETPKTVGLILNKACQSLFIVYQTASQHYV
jgi:hypothetical protein